MNTMNHSLVLTQGFRPPLHFERMPSIPSLKSLGFFGIAYKIALSASEYGLIRQLGPHYNRGFLYTFWLFREQLTEAGVIEKAFDQFEAYLCEQGFSARKGQIVDASIVPVPKQRNSREENKRIKQGEVTEDWSEQKKRQKDTEARWTKKNGQNYYGYKNHIDVDVKHKLIRSYEVTSASVHDSQVFEGLLDEDNRSRDVWVDSAYRSEEKLRELKQREYREHLQRKGCKHKKLTDREAQGNRTRSRIRSRVEHVFGVQAKRAGRLIVRAIGLVRVKVKVGLRNLAYNLDRYCVLVGT